MAQPKSLRIGVLLETVQLSDITGIDIFGNISSAYTEIIAKMDPRLEALKPLSIPTIWFYISSSLEPTECMP